MRQILELLPGAQLPDPARESDDPGVALTLVDDGELIRPSAEDALLPATKTRSTLGTRAPTSPLARHLPWTLSPLDPALPAPIGLRLELEGTRIVGADVEIGHLHQALEKRLQALPVDRALAFVQHAAPLAPEPWQIALARACERVLGVDEDPVHTRRWRRVALELSRISEHLCVLRAPTLDLDARSQRVLDTAWRAVDALRAGLSQARTFAAVGGMRRALHPDEARAIGRALGPALAPLQSLDESRAFGRWRGVGVLARSAAVELGVTGPALRACGVEEDVRVDDGMRPATRMGGCSAARLGVRLEEVRQSGAFVTREVEHLAETTTTLPARAIAPDVVLPMRQGIARVEAAAGELCAVVVGDGTPRAARVRLRPAALAIVGALPVALVDVSMDDAAAVVASFGLRASECDR